MCDDAYKHFAEHIFEYNMLGQEKFTRQHAHSNRAQKRERNVFFSFLPLRTHFCKVVSERVQKLLIFVTVCASSSGKLSLSLVLSLLKMLQCLNPVCPTKTISTFLYVYSYTFWFESAPQFSSHLNKAKNPRKKIVQKRLR